MASILMIVENEAQRPPVAEELAAQGHTVILLKGMKRIRDVITYSNPDLIILDPKETNRRDLSGEMTREAAQKPSVIAVDFFRRRQDSTPLKYNDFKLPAKIGVILARRAKGGSRSLSSRELAPSQLTA